jgi:hypothetical protein
MVAGGGPVWFSSLLLGQPSWQVRASCLAKRFATAHRLNATRVLSPSKYKSFNCRYVFLSDLGGGDIFF